MTPPAPPSLPLASPPSSSGCLRLGRYIDSDGHGAVSRDMMRHVTALACGSAASHTALFNVTAALPGPLA
eukprot:2111604-Rhodomonas_salina.8